MINVHVLKNAWKTQSLLSDHFFQAMHNGPESTKVAARALAKFALKGIPQSNVERPMSPWMLLRDLRLKHQVRFGLILMYSLPIYESFVGSPKEGIVCAELQGIQEAASQWLKLCFLRMAPRWGGLGDVGVVGIC